MFSKNDILLLPSLVEPWGLVVENNGNVIFSGNFENIVDLDPSVMSHDPMMLSLLKSNTELERFAYIASHDLQEPIRMITNFSDIIAKDYAHVLDDEGKIHNGDLFIPNNQRNCSIFFGA